MKLNFKTHLVMGFAAAMLILSFTPKAFAVDNEATQAILTHHLEAFGAADLEAIMSDYTDSSVLIVPGAELTGIEEITPVFVGLFAEFAKPGATFEMKHLVVNGDIAYIVWVAETADNIYELGTDTFVIEDGKIAMQTFAAKVTPKN
jgi:ketosteroid isomerase-like protein